MQKTICVGLDIHKASLSVSVAEDGCDGPVRFIGAIPNTPIALSKLARQLARGNCRLEFCYEVGGCGYGIYRQLTKLGHACAVVATSMIPRKPGERVKTDRRDSQKLAILHRTGDLTPVRVEAARSYRYPARAAKENAEIIVRQPKSIRAIAWKAQVRLCRRFRALSASGKRPTVVVAAIARELSGFVWQSARR